MVALWVRWGVAAAGTAAGWFFVPEAFPVVWKSALALAALAIVGWRLEARGLATPTVAAGWAAAEAYCLAFALSASGHIQTVGFLVLAPCLWASARFAAPAVTMAPLAASALFVSSAALGASLTDATGLFVQAAAVLLVGLLATPREAPAPLALLPAPDPAPLFPRAVEVAEEDLLEMRERYRQLRDAYLDLERKGERDRLLAKLLSLRRNPGPGWYQGLADLLRELTSATSASVYTVALHRKAMVVRGSAGEVPEAMVDAALEVDPGQAVAIVRHHADKATAALLEPEQRGCVENVLLTDRGRPVGLICLVAQTVEAAEDARRLLESIAPEVAALLAEETRRETQARRLAEAELLYEVATLTTAHATPVAIAARVVRELWEALDLDHVSLLEIVDGQPQRLASKGVADAFLEAVRFSGGTGLAAWAAEEPGELVLFDARSDRRCDPREALKRRLGALALLPIEVDGQPSGVLVAATHRAGGLEPSALEMLRTIASDLGPALRRTRRDAPLGWVSPSEFAAHIRGRRGSVVVLEPLRKEETEDTVGKPAWAQALRRWTARLVAKLPSGGALCRTETSEILAFLPNRDEDEASAWANEAVAVAAMLGVRSPDGNRKAPLAARSKVAAYSSQENRIQAEKVA